MRTTIITSWQQLSDLQDEWNSLLRSSSSDTIFLSWEWIQAWRSVVGENIELLVIAVHDQDGRLVGIAPFYKYQLTFLGLIPFKALRILADYATGSEYPDWIVSPDCEEEALSAITQALLNAQQLWDLIWMPRIAGWTGAYARITQAAHRSGMLVHSRTDAFSNIILPKSFYIYEHQFSSKRRKNLRRIRSHLLSSPGVDVIYCQEQSEIPRFLNALFDLHHRRRTILGDPGCFIRKPSEADFYRQFVPLALDRGWLRLCALIQDDVMQAVQIGYVYNDEYLAMQEGFNPNFINGVGNVLRHVSIENLIDEGLKSYDFLGGVSEHKRLWHAEERLGHDLLIARPSFKNRLIFQSEIWPTGRYLTEVGLFDGN
jgi:CelD/BcsL family acetyltransferase involved in cellulose biosynthesis